MLRLPVWLAGLWWASLTTIGFMVVPLLFVHLPTPAIAGSMAAKLFTAQTWVSVCCGMLLLYTQSKSSLALVAINKFAIVFVIGGVLLALLAEFAVAPRIVARENLKVWHSVGSVMYLLQWVCAAATFTKVMSPLGQPD